MPYLGPPVIDPGSAQPFQQNGNWALSYVFTNADVDFTGATVISEIRDPRDPVADDPAAVFTISDLSAIDGSLTFTRSLAYGVINALTVGREYETDITIVFPDAAGPQKPFLPMRLCVQPTITQVP